VDGQVEDVPASILLVEGAIVDTVVSIRDMIIQFTVVQVERLTDNTGVEVPTLLPGPPEHWVYVVSYLLLGSYLFAIASHLHEGRLYVPGLSEELFFA